MKPPADFYERLPERSDEELYEMLVHTSDYLPETLEAAREELCRRNLTPERAAGLEVATQAVTRAAPNKRARQKPNS